MMITTNGGVSYEVEEAICCCESDDWQCYIDSSDVRCLRATNKTEITFPDPSPNSIGVQKVDIGVRTAVPADYAVIVLEVDPTPRHPPSPLGDYDYPQHQQHHRLQLLPECVRSPFPRIANGVVDSGYRGNVSILVYYDQKKRRIDRGGLVVRLALVKLATVCPVSRMLFDLYDAGADYECGFQFVSSIRTAADSDAADGERQTPPDGNDVWDGTGCESLACLRNDGVRNSTHYHTSDPRIAFVVRTGHATVMGVRPGPFPSLPDESIGPVRFFTSGEFATLLPFEETFSVKRAEDAGYDITSPVDVVLEPMTVTAITVRQRYICQDGSLIPCVYGRSSMNAKGLPVIPSRWMSNEWLVVSVCNLNCDPVMIRAGDRIAQLLLIARDGNVWLPFGVNASEPFPRAKESRFECRGTCAAVPRWRPAIDFDAEAPASDRNKRGFGSSGV